MHVVWSLSVPRYSVCRPENQESRVGCCPSLEPEKTKLQLRERRASAQHILTCSSSVPSGSHEAGGYPGQWMAASPTQSTDDALPDAPTVVLTKYLGALEPSQVDT